MMSDLYTMHGSFLTGVTHYYKPGEWQQIQKWAWNERPREEIQVNQKRQSPPPETGITILKQEQAKALNEQQKKWHCMTHAISARLK
jgi:hypothetical protein